jgi:undecaprenyl-phosphate 4-deoxy-4-formamido-L-arabinose transferase
LRFIGDEISKSNNPFPYIDALIFQVTQNVGVIAVRHDARSAGESGYTLRALIRLWTSMLINSSMSLRLAAALGLLMSAVGFVSFITVLIETLSRSTFTCHAARSGTHAY